MKIAIGLTSLMYSVLFCSIFIFFAVSSGHSILLNYLNIFERKEAKRK